MCSADGAFQFADLGHKVTANFTLCAWLQWCSDWWVKVKSSRRPITRCVNFANR